MPKTREQIKHDPVSSETWRNNRTAVLWFDPRQIKPLGDHILVELDQEDRDLWIDRRARGLLVKPETAEKEIGTRVGTVLAVGPGKLKEEGSNTLSYVLNRVVRTKMLLKPGDRVVIGHYSDWESHNCSADGHESRDQNIVLCQQNDVRFVIEN